MTEIPPDALEPATLRAVIEEFITRHGAVHGHAESDLDTQVGHVMKQLKSRRVVLVFDEEQGTCNILPRDELDRAVAADQRSK